MVAFLIRRILQALLILLVVAVIVFLAVYAMGNPVDALLSPDSDQKERAAAIVRLGLDLPLYQQFGVFLWNALHGDIGTSFVYGSSAMGVIMDRFPATLELALAALGLATIIGIPLGVLAGLKSNTTLGRSIMTGSILGFSLPNFWIGLMLILVFAVYLRILPSGGRGETVSIAGIHFSFLTLDGLRHLILPALTLALYKVSLVIRICEAGTREVMLQDYVRFARAKGVAPLRIVCTHILKNVLIPVVTIMGMETGALIAFAVVVETVFAYPGMGKLLIDSVTRLDRPVIVSYLLVTTVVFVVLNLIVDLIYMALDPRVRLTDEGGA
jgi:peptide/nickel transport system permease protein